MSKLYDDHDSVNAPANRASATSHQQPDGGGQVHSTSRRAALGQHAVIISARRVGDDLELVTSASVEPIVLTMPARAETVSAAVARLGVLTRIDAQLIAESWGTTSIRSGGEAGTENVQLDALVEQLQHFVGLRLPEDDEDAVRVRAEAAAKVRSSLAKFVGRCACGSHFEAGTPIRWSKARAVVSCLACEPGLVVPTKAAKKSDSPNAPETPPPASIQTVRDFVVPAGYELAADGVYRGFGGLDDDYQPDVTRPMPDARRMALELVAPRPLIIEAMAEPIDESEKQLQLVFFDDRVQRRMVWVPRRTIADARSVLELARHGYPVDSENARAIVLYLRAALAENAPKLKHAFLSRRYGCFRVQGEYEWRLADTTIGSRSIEMVEGDTNPYSAALTLGGAAKEWTAFVQPLWARHAIVRFSVAANFASVLLRFLRQRSFLFHLWGPSGVGKTALARLGATAFGDPDILCSTLNRTQNSVTEIFAHLDDFAILLDELQVSTVDRGQLVYGFTTGKGRGRANKEGGVRREPTWSAILRTTGEEPLLGSAGRRDLGGQANRVLDLEIRRGLPKEDTKAIYTFLAERHFGHAGRQFLEALQNIVNDEERAKALRSNHQVVRSRIVWRLGSEHERIGHIAVVATAQAMVDEILFGVPTLEAVERAVADAVLVAEVCAVGQDEQRPLADRAMGFVRGHSVSSPLQYRSVAVVGTEEEPRSSLPIVAYRSADGRELWYIPAAIDAVLEKEGYAARRVWSDLAERGIIERAGKNLRVQRQFGDVIPRGSFYVMSTSHLQEPTP